MKWVALALLAVGVAAPASGDLWVKSCRTTNETSGVVGSTRLSENQFACWRFVSTDGTPTSPRFEITAPTALICLNTDTTDATAGPGGGSATVMPELCLGATASAETCINIMDTGPPEGLDGTEGSDSAQNACIRVGSGFYQLRVSAAATGAETPEVYIIAEGSD